MRSLLPKFAAKSFVLKMTAAAKRGLALPIDFPRVDDLFLVHGFLVRAPRPMAIFTAVFCRGVRIFWPARFRGVMAGETGGGTNQIRGRAGRTEE